MSKLVVATIADDRWGRKDGLYTQTQEKIRYILENNPQLGVAYVKSWTWEDISSTQWYENNKTLLDNKDAARNGRAYKPFIISQALKDLENGDYVVYTDCSPEMWNMDRETILPFAKFNIDVIKRLCRGNNDILTVFVKWDTKTIKGGQYGIHTHKNFTLNRCIDKMGLREYENSYMHASGMWCIRKTPATVEFVEEWLKWNTDEDCASLGYISIPDDYSFWEAESHKQFGKPGYKMGHRHDQSISGLLLNKRNAKFVDILYNDMSPYNFLQYTRTDVGFKFIDGNPPPSPYEPLVEGDIVVNNKGVELRIIRIEDEDTYVVGRSDGSCYATTRDKLNLKK